MEARKIDSTRVRRKEKYRYRKRGKRHRHDIIEICKERQSGRDRRDIETEG